MSIASQVTRATSEIVVDWPRVRPHLALAPAWRFPDCTADAEGPLGGKACECGRREICWPLLVWGHCVFSLCGKLMVYKESQLLLEMN